MYTEVMDPEFLEVCRGWWHDLLRPFAANEGLRDEAFKDVVRRYSEPTRFYHNCDHLCTVVKWTRLLAEEAPVVQLAAYFHDVIYDPRAADNEERSAEYAHEVLASLGVPRKEREEVARLILLTKTHQAAEDDRAGEALLDADLAVLGCEEVFYDAYAAAIRKEYAWVPDTEYRAGRARVLERFLFRSFVYHHPAFRKQIESQARANLKRELASLQGSR